MSDLGWRANGIERARACGGVELERYRCPGFVGGFAVRRSSESPASGSGFEVSADWSWEDDDTDPSEKQFKRRARR